MKNVSKIASALVLGALRLARTAVANAQSLSYNRGQNVSPAFEGWEEAADGTKYFLFGYMNRNWEEELNVPVGPDNSFTPGTPDQGQPTHFLPRRNRFVFRVPVPKNFTEKDEMIWTLTTYGKTEKAYATLRLDYKVDDVVKASETGALGAGTSSPEVRANKPPVAKVEGPKTLNAKVGQPVTLTMMVTDDGVPKPRGAGFAGAAVSNSGSRRHAPIRRQRRETDCGATKPRDAAAVAEHGRQERRAAPLVVRVPRRPGTGDLRSRTDQVVGRHPHRSELTVVANLERAEMPKDGKVSSNATFSEPGTYTLRGVADDGALTGNDDVTVTVTK